MRKILIAILVLMNFQFVSTYAQVIRKNWREMTNHEKDVYVSAVRSLYTKSPNLIETYVSTHANSTYVRHQQLDFLIWHRIFIYYFEKALINSGVSGASLIALPYWGWETSGDWSSGSPMFSSGSNNLGLFGRPIPEGTFSRGFGQSTTQPTATELQNLSTNYTQFGTDYSTQQGSNFWPRLEAIYHNNYHVFIGGASGTMSFVNISPRDPIFYQHHCYVDKIWQDWHNKNGSSSIANQNVLINTIPGQPQMTRASLIDSRLLKVWYAYNGQVVLDKYTVSSTENYLYTGDILMSNAASPVTNAFTVPASTVCNVISGSNVYLKPGFYAVNGSTFSAKVDPVSNASSIFNTGRESIDFGNAISKTEEAFDESKLHAYPNPSQGGRFTIGLLSNQDINYTYKVYNTVGNPVIIKSEISSDKSFDIDLSSHPTGMYLLHLKDAGNGKVYFKKIISN